MDEEILLKRRLIDTANKAYRQNIYTYTNFLSMSELDTYYRTLPELSFIHSEAFGGSASCERQIVRFGSPDDFGFDEPYPIDCIKISPLLRKFADDLTHRDFLGAILNLGILIRDNVGYLFCLSHISTFIMENLIKIKHTNVKCEPAAPDTDDFAPVLEDLELICASARIDAVTASITKLYALKPDDILVIRGTGKFIYKGCGNETRKGRVYVRLQKYV